jgi:large subunit ribosomal protein L10
MEKKISKAIAQKKVEVKEISEKLKKAQSVVFVDYRGIKVNDDTNLRRVCRKAGIEYTVLKNKIVMRALNDMGIKDLDKTLEGPTAFAFGYNDIVAPAKIIAENVAAKKLASIKGGLIEGKSATKEQVSALALIPDKKTLIAQLLCMLNAPIRGLAVALQAIADKA